MRSAEKPPQLSHRYSGGDGLCARMSSAESSDFSFSVRLATEQDPVAKEPKTDAEPEDMILQRLVIGGVFVETRSSAGARRGGPHLRIRGTRRNSPTRSLRSCERSSR